MPNTSELIQIILDGWRYYDDENDLPRFETLLEAAIAAIDATSDIYADKILRNLFKEAAENAESSDKGEHLHK